ncbi:MAG: hypothetical protein AMXMBFR82_03190 [Candidatus Hydrogenedentota bacterium]
MDELNELQELAQTLQQRKDRRHLITSFNYLSGQRRYDKHREKYGDLRIIARKSPIGGDLKWSG